MDSAGGSQTEHSQDDSAHKAAIQQQQLLLAALHGGQGTLSSATLPSLSGSGLGQHPLNSAGAAALGGLGSGNNQAGGLGLGGGNGASKSARVCRHFVRGRCTWGAQCRFSHDVSAIGSLGAGGLDGPGMGSLGGAGGMAGLAGAAPFLPGGAKPGGMGYGALHQSLRPRDDAATRSAWLGVQQQTLQSQRHAILIAALQAKFQIRTVGGATTDGVQRGQVILTSLANAPEIVINVFNEQQVAAMLESLESDERVREGGLHYFIGESSVFWSMMRLWHVSGSTTSAKWDAVLEKAAQSGHVECMFEKTAVGCLAQRCAFEHVLPPRTSALENLSNPTNYGIHPSLAAAAKSGGGGLAGLNTGANPFASSQAQGSGGAGWFNQAGGGSGGHNTGGGNDALAHILQQAHQHHGSGGGGKGMLDDLINFDDENSGGGKGENWSSTAGGSHKNNIW